MTKDEELQELRQENRALREALQRKDEELQQSRRANQDLREGLKQAIRAIESHQEQINTFEGLISSQQERIKTLEGQQAKDSHNSSLPPSSDRFVPPVKSLRKKSGKKPGGQKKRAIVGIISDRQRRPMRSSFIQWFAVSIASTICMLSQHRCLSDARSSTCLPSGSGSENIVWKKNSVPSVFI